MAAFDGTADLIQAKFGNKGLEKEIPNVKKALLLWGDTCSLRKIYRNFPVFLIIEFCFFSCFAFSPC